MPAKVALLIETSRAYGRGLLRGVAAYARTHGPWSIYHHERALGDAVPDWLRRWRGDGIIARIESRQLADYIRELALPTVDLRGLYIMPEVPLIETNDLTVVRLACTHLIERGFRNFAYCGFDGTNYSNVRREHAIKYLAERGITIEIRDSPHLPAHDTTEIEAEGLLHEEELAEWLAALPKPTGIIACNDLRGAQILAVCREHGITVPDDVAVIGVDNDELICELTTPPLSSIAPDTYRIGYLAGDLLDRLMKGGSPPTHTALVNPLGVVVRQSTDLLAIDDRDIAAAMAYIRRHACEGITVDDVAAAVHLSRSTLDRRFTKLAGVTAKAEITRCRVERVKQLLVDTDYKLSVIAGMVGFAHAEYMSTMFKEHTGETPGSYRRIHQSLRRGPRLESAPQLIR